MSYYFLYRLKIQPNGGGLPPKRVDGVQLGLAEYCDWILGSTEDPSYISYISDFNAVPITEEIANGMTLLENYCDCDSCESFSTQEEEDLANTAKYFISKLRVRSEINARVGDIYDVASDLNKRIEILEHIIVELMDHILNNTEISERTLKMFNRVKANQALYEFVIDLFNDEELETLIEDLGSKDNEVAELLAPYYNSQETG